MSLCWQRIKHLRKAAPVGLADRALSIGQDLQLAAKACSSPFCRSRLSTLPRSAALASAISWFTRIELLKIGSYPRHDPDSTSRPEQPAQFRHTQLQAYSGLRQTDRAAGKMCRRKWRSPGRLFPHPRTVEQFVACQHNQRGLRSLCPALPRWRWICGLITPRQPTTRRKPGARKRSSNNRKEDAGSCASWNLSLILRKPTIPDTRGSSAHQLQSGEIPAAIGRSP